MAKRQPPKKKFRCVRPDPTAPASKPPYYYIVAWNGGEFFDLFKISYHDYYASFHPVLPDAAANMIFSSLN